MSFKGNSGKPGADGLQGEAGIGGSIKSKFVVLFTAIGRLINLQMHLKHVLSWMLALVPSILFLAAYISLFRLDCDWCPFLEMCSFFTFEVGSPVLMSKKLKPRR